jgi:hypothetical protein
VPLPEPTAIDSASGEWRDDDVEVLADEVVVGRIMKACRRAGRLAVDVDTDIRLGRTPTPGYAASREAAMAAFAKSWRSE